jgi:hypothetical protein
MNQPLHGSGTALAARPGDTRTAEARALMMRFAERTGLTSNRPARRYLWTDAFAVCNFLGLATATGDVSYGDLALRLVDQVHHQLGRYRADEHDRSGWISGLHDSEAEAHPTCGGLRIGKPLRERSLAEPLDPGREWDRDGQYFHYLTKWMHALDQTARWTGQSRFNEWARELAYVAHQKFTYGPPGARRMVWKLSTDLSRPLVPSMGQHDPLDGFVSYTQLERTADALLPVAAARLHGTIADFAEMVDRAPLATTDPLGIGGLLVDAFRLAQVGADGERIAALLEASVTGLEAYVSEPDLRTPAHFRLAFRELGLAIGLTAMSMLETEPLARGMGASGQASLERLAQFQPLHTEITSFWMEPHHRRTSSWIEHADINEVMLATSIAPNGFVKLDVPRKG